MSNNDLVEAAQRILPLIDLTSLESSDDTDKVQQLCRRAITPWGNVAAVCIYPSFIGDAKSALLKSQNIALATVVNFPDGDQPLEKVVEGTESAIELGADEIDLVFPYRAFLSENLQPCHEMLSEIRRVCSGPIKLKVILETGEMRTQENIIQATDLAIAHSVDYIKTSTGKVAINATLEAAKTILSRIHLSGNKHIGFKASGGIRTVEEAVEYLAIADGLMGQDWTTKTHFRFGASSLLENVIGHLSHSSN